MTNTTQDLVTEIIQALTPIFQKHLEANVSEVKTEKPIKEKKNERFELTFERIGKHTRLNTKIMREIVELKMQSKKQKTIAKIINKSEPTVSNYLKAFQKHYQEAQKNIQTKLSVA
jgi:C-terminal processing protease CtpA/Prc